MKALFASVLISMATWLHGGEIQRIDQTPGSGKTVVAPAAPLIHTAQLLPLDASGNVAGKGNAAAQTRKVLENLRLVVDGAGGSFLGVVKLNVYVRNASDVAAVQSEIAGAFGLYPPAVSFVEGELIHRDALVSLDAIGVSQRIAAGVQFVTVKGVHKTSGAHAAVLPHGRRVYISGMASKGEMGPATADTMKQLWSVLEFLKLSGNDVVQLKAFIGPMSRKEEAEKGIAAVFAGKMIPPVIFVDWVSNLPIEIELIAAAGAEDTQLEVVEYLTPPGTKASPVYSRVARINSGKTVYTSGLYAAPGQTAGAQVREIFSILNGIGEKSGTDFLHLAKATYYVSTEAMGTELTKIRPEFYDPKRPPAASKAQVGGVAREGCGITLDMIAAQKK